MSANGRVRQRRAIEALRSGVPNRDAVRELGSAQLAIEERFRALLDELRRGGQPRGLLIRGDFGSGKSHLIEYLHHLALTENYVASKVVISKETPLHDPGKVFRTAVAAAIVPDKRGSALGEVAGGLDFGGELYGELRRWAESDEASLNERFAATLYLFENTRTQDREFADRIIRFWSGDPIGVGELKRKLRESGEAATYPLSKVTARELAVQRFRFAARLIQAAGYSGWVLFFDEVELIGRYSLLQRARSYAELARWLAALGPEPVDGVAAVMAITQDFETEVIDGKRDDENVPNRLRTRGDDALAALAEVGMRALVRDYVDLERPDTQVLESTYQALREIHGAAYDWTPPELSREGESLTLTANMRAFVRRWIYEWDLRRLDPAYRPQIEIQPVRIDYSEEPELEEPSEGSAPEGEE
jgi:hypothetical protein